MYAPQEHAPNLCHHVLSMACPGFLTVPQGGMWAPPAEIDDFEPQSYKTTLHYLLMPTAAAVGFIRGLGGSLKEVLLSKTSQ